MLYAEKITLLYDKPILKKVSFKLLPGELVGLVGKSGAGKSSLLKILAGYLQPNEGQIFFENTELIDYMDKNAENIEDIYSKTIARKLQNEKQLMVQELKHYGIHSILTTPTDLSINTINKYLAFKSRGLI